MSPLFPKVGRQPRDLLLSSGMGQNCHNPIQIFMVLQVCSVCETILKNCGQRLHTALF